MKMKRTLKIGAVVALLTALALLAWGLIEPYTLDERAYAVAVPNLPAELQGERLAVISDFQIGMWLDNRSTVERAVEAAIEAQPAAVLILGDFIYGVTEPDAPEIEAAAALVRPLTQAGIPTYAVLGNHDYHLPKPENRQRPDVANALRQALEQAGVVVLVNEAAPLPDHQAFYVVGIGSRYAGLDFPEQALANVPPDAARVVIMHNPDSFPAVPANSGPLSAAGHTHGGQLRLPFLPGWSYLALVQPGEVHVDGWIDSSYGQEGNRLYVNRGIGFSMLPLRFNAPPELTFFRLQGSDGGALDEPQEVRPPQ
jgi:predicted MPP superfamily phosphohydrolase